MPNVVNSQPAYFGEISEKMEFEMESRNEFLSSRRRKTLEHDPLSGEETN